MNKSKSCFNCRNKNICVHKTRIFEKLELTLFIVSDAGGLVTSIANSIGVRCKYYDPYTQEEKEDRGIDHEREYE